MPYSAITCLSSLNQFPTCATVTSLRAASMFFATFDWRMGLQARKRDGQHVPSMDGSGFVRSARCGFWISSANSRRNEWWTGWPVDESRMTHVARVRSLSGDNCWRWCWTSHFDQPPLRCWTIGVRGIPVTCAARRIWTKVTSLSPASASFSFCSLVGLETCRLWYHCMSMVCWLMWPVGWYVNLNVRCEMPFFVSN